MDRPFDPYDVAALAGSGEDGGNPAATDLAVAAPDFALSKTLLRKFFFLGFGVTSPPNTDASGACCHLSFLPLEFDNGESTLPITPVGLISSITLMARNLRLAKLPALVALKSLMPLIKLVLVSCVDVVASVDFDEVVLTVVALDNDPSRIKPPTISYADRLFGLSAALPLLAPERALFGLKILSSSLYIL